jgi:hypothetical protein
MIQQDHRDSLLLINGRCLDVRISSPIWQSLKKFQTIINRKHKRTYRQTDRPMDCRTVGQTVRKFDGLLVSWKVRQTDRQTDRQTKTMSTSRFSIGLVECDNIKWMIILTKITISQKFLKIANAS